MRRICAEAVKLGVWFAWVMLLSPTTWAAPFKNPCEGLLLSRLLHEKGYVVKGGTPLAFEIKKHAAAMERQGGYSFPPELLAKIRAAYSITSEHNVPDLLARVSAEVYLLHQIQSPLLQVRTLQMIDEVFSAAIQLDVREKEPKVVDANNPDIEDVLTDLRGRLLEWAKTEFFEHRGIIAESPVNASLIKILWIYGDHDTWTKIEAKEPRMAPYILHLSRTFREWMRRPKRIFGRNYVSYQPYAAPPEGVFKEDVTAAIELLPPDSEEAVAFLQQFFEEHAPYLSPNDASFLVEELFMEGRGQVGVLMAAILQPYTLHPDIIADAITDIRAHFANTKIESIDEISEAEIGFFALYAPLEDARLWVNILRGRFGQNASIEILDSATYAILMREVRAKNARPIP